MTFWSKFGEKVSKNKESRSETTKRKQQILTESKDSQCELQKNDMLQMSCTYLYILCSTQRLQLFYFTTICNEKENIIESLKHLGVMLIGNKKDIYDLSNALCF